MLDAYRGNPILLAANWETIIEPRFAASEMPSPSVAAGSLGLIPHLQHNLQIWLQDAWPLFEIIQQDQRHKTASAESTWPHQHPVKSVTYLPELGRG